MLVVIGPSGAGKSTVVRALAARSLLTVHPTWTTRPRRPDEHGPSGRGSGQVGDTIEHVFVTEEEFARREAEGFFVGTVTPFGLPHRYGLPRFTPGAGTGVDTVMLRASLVGRFRDTVGEAVVYQIENSATHAAARLEARGDAPDESGCRLDGFAEEVRLGEDLARRVFVNEDDIEDVIARVDAAVREDFGLPAAATAPPPQRRPQRAPTAAPVPAPGAPKQRSTAARVAVGVGLGLFIFAAVLGLLVLAFAILTIVTLSSWSSNK